MMKWLARLLSSILHDRLAVQTLSSGTHRYFARTVGFLLLLCVLTILFIGVGCGESTVDRDRPRAVLTWSFPDNFEPSFITESESGTRWGLFVSRLYSGKDNLWAVKSAEGEWKEPILLMNAYYFEHLEFSVEDHILRLVFEGIEEAYFWDYRCFLEDSIPFPDTIILEFSVVELTMDKDRDGLPDRLEKEILLSDRLPDSDADGKADNVDFCPLAKPLEHADRFTIYREAVMYLLQLDDPSKFEPREDTAWTRYYGVYYIHQPTVVFLALPGERFMPELVNLPILAIQARSPLYFTSVQLYTSSTGGVIPHLVFEKPAINLTGNHAEMAIVYATHKYSRESATIHLTKNRGTWEVEGVSKDE